MSLAEISLADFTPHVGQKFPVNRNLPQPLALELLSVQPSRRAPSAGGRQSFSLLFRAPPAWTCRQDNYPLLHPTRGELVIFLVPVGRTAEGTELEAVFNFL